LRHAGVVPGTSLSVPDASLATALSAAVADGGMSQCTAAAEVAVGWASGTDPGKMVKVQAQHGAVNTPRGLLEAVALGAAQHTGVW